MIKVYKINTNTKKKIGISILYIKIIVWIEILMTYFFLTTKKKICRQFCLFQHIYTIILIYMQGSKFYRQTLRSDKDK